MIYRYKKWQDGWHFYTLAEASINISNTCVRWGRFNPNIDEKYGFLRSRYVPWGGTITELLFPRTYFYSFSSLYILFYEKIDKPIISKINKFLGVKLLVTKWHSIIYNYAIQTQCKINPDLIDELICDIDMYNWVKPGILGPIDGEKIRKRYWEDPHFR